MSLNYRIYTDELDFKVDVLLIPTELYIRKFNGSQSDLFGLTMLLNNSFPKTFKVIADLDRLFISEEYYDANNLFVAVVKKTEKFVSFSGYQVLENFDTPSASILYTCTQEEYRRKGLLRAIYNTIRNQAIESGIKKLYLIAGKEAYNNGVYRNMGLTEMSEEDTIKYVKYIQGDMKCQ